MRINTGWPSKPSHIVLTLIILATLTQIQPCNATEQQNKTLTEITSYHFEKGYYNVVKFAEDDQAEYMIVHETKTPYYNLTYTAPRQGLLEVTLKPSEGYVPYIELSLGWDTDGLTYTKPMLANETSNILLTPPMRFSDQNLSRMSTGPIICWEMYQWDNTSGSINCTFTPSDDITFELLMYPTNPKQGDPIDLFTISNSNLKNIKWDFPKLNWINESETLEINGLDAGKYHIYVTGEDIFNNTHKAQLEFTVSPPSLNSQSYDLNFFSVNCPEIVSQGDQVDVSATIDYSMPTSADIKCQLYDPVENAVCKELVYRVSDSGSKQFNHQFIADEEGVEPLIMKLYYNVGDEWVEVSEAETNLSITINKAQTSTSIPGFNLISIISGLLLITILSRNQKNN